MHQNEVKSGRFTLWPHYQDFVIECDGTNLEISPAESTILIGMLAAVSGMQNFKSLPPLVVEKPFRITLNEEGTCALTRDFEDNGISFPIYNIEELVDGVQTMVRKIQDMNRIAGGPQVAPKTGPTEPPFGGR